MKKTLFCLAFATSVTGTLAHASNVDFSVGVNISNRPTVAVPAPPAPVYAPPAPVYAEPVVIEEPPVFIQPPQLGFYAAVGIPYDMFFISGSYYLYRGNAWYAAPRYNGPWASVRYRSLPPGLRRHSYDKVRYYRDAGYRQYRAHNSPYWDKHHFRPGKELKEHRKAEKRYWKDERKAEKQYWKKAGNDNRDYGKHGSHHD
jgi:hypothetical protein